MGFWGKKKPFTRISTELLQPGMHISLAERWWDHPFLTSVFTLQSEDQIQIIRELGMTDVLWCEAASEKGPRELGSSQPKAPAGPDLLAQARAERDRRRDKTRRNKELSLTAEKSYSNATSQLREAFSLIYSSPQEAVGKARGVAAEVASAFSSDGDVSIVLLSNHLASNNTHTHAINVMLLSMMIGKSLEVGEPELASLGLGALFHDIGKIKVPDSIKLKPAAEWTRSDLAYMQMHTELGVKITLGLPEFSNIARGVVALHHEHWNGSGYPYKLAGEKIPAAARYVSVADRYDNLCNPRNHQDAIPPSEALARMFKSERENFDPAALPRFIKSMGVYPPGSLVELSNGTLGLVTSVNRNNTLRPLVTIWQEATKPEDAPVIDLSVEPELSISRTLRVTELEPEVAEYLNPRSRTAYFYAKALAD